jgi:hypothetical protein
MSAAAHGVWLDLVVVSSRGNGRSPVSYSGSRDRAGRTSSRRYSDAAPRRARTGLRGHALHIVCEAAAATASGPGVEGSFGRFVSLPRRREARYGSRYAPGASTTIGHVSLAISPARRPALTDSRTMSPAYLGRPALGSVSCSHTTVPSTSPIGVGDAHYHGDNRGLGGLRDRGRCGSNPDQT